MKFSLRSSAAIPCLAALLAFAGSAHAATVTNGNFAGGLGGWTVAGSGITPGIGITGVTLGPPGPTTPFGDVIPLDGSISTAAYFVDDSAVESISQSITLLANTTYNLTFDLFGVLSGAGNAFDFKLVDKVGAVASSSFGNGAQPGVTPVPNGVWTPELLTFTTGAATTYTLEFDFTSGATPAKDLALTNVAIATPSVPEPSSIVLFGTGLLSAAGMLRRRFIK